MDKEKANKFLEEYKELCKKHGFIIGSCGCCDSPWVEEEDGKYLENYTEHLKSQLE